MGVGGAAVWLVLPQGPLRTKLYLNTKCMVETVSDLALETNRHSNADAVRCSLCNVFVAANLAQGGCGPDGLRIILIAMRVFRRMKATAEKATEEEVGEESEKEVEKELEKELMAQAMRMAEELEKAEAGGRQKGTRPRRSRSQKRKRK